MPVIKDLTGKQFAAWTVIGRSPNKRCRVHWICRCVCGDEKEVSGIHLVRGTSKSCGCIRPRGPKHVKFKHGKPNTYSVWLNMIQRCENPRNLHYKNYGGRGIKICESWRVDFRVFANDMGPRPSPEHQIERIDNSRGYEASNCCWGTRKEQMRNTRRNHIVTYDGKKMPLIQAAELAGVNYGTAQWRLQNGRTDEEALRAETNR